MKEVSRAILHTFNQGLAKIDPCLNREPKNPPLPPIFIVGSPRSGTTLTYQLILQLIVSAYFSKPMEYIYGGGNLYALLFRKFLGRPRPNFSSNYGAIEGFLGPTEHHGFWRQWVPDSPNEEHKWDSQNLTSDRIERLRNSVNSISSIFDKPLIIKCLYLDLNVSELQRIFPGSKYIYVKRNPVDVCASIFKKRSVMNNPQEWWSVRIPGYKNLYGFPLWKQVVHQVYTIEREIERDIASMDSGRSFVIQYDELCQQPGRVLGNIETWLKPDGYTAYTDWQVPTRFEVSRQYIDNDFNSKIRKYLKELAKGEKI